MNSKHQTIQVYILKYVFFFIVLVLSNVTNAQDLKAGIRVQKTQEMYWENGFSLQYTFSNFKPKQLYLGFNYISSRIGSAYRSNAIKQDSYILSAWWIFKPERKFKFGGRLNIGYFYSDLEYDIFDAIPNDAFLLSPEIGIMYEFKSFPISVYLGTGYNISTVEQGYSPGTLQPLYYHLDLYISIFKTKKHE